MKIAVIGWGSLIWDPRELSISAPFEVGGPNLPIEFCRVAKDHRLTLIIDETYGTLIPTYAATSACTTLSDAFENLRAREGMTGVGDIGSVEIATDNRSISATERHPHALETIADWAQSNGYDAAIWTALEYNFEERTGEPFSVTAAMRFLGHLKEQDEEAFARALAYIRNAPAATQTPVRAAVAEQWPEA